MWGIATVNTHAWSWDQKHKWIIDALIRNIVHHSLLQWWKKFDDTEIWRDVYFFFFFCKQEADFITTRTIDKRDSPTHSAVWRSAFLFRLLLQLRHWERDKRSYCDRKFRWIISEQVFKFTRGQHRFARFNENNMKSKHVSVWHLLNIFAFRVNLIKVYLILNIFVIVLYCKCYTQTLHTLLCVQLVQIIHNKKLLRKSYKP